MNRLTFDFLSSLDGFSCTGKPDIALVEKAEADLGLSFAEDYKSLAILYGAISFRGHNLSGISPYPGNDVVALTKENRSYYSEVPLSYYVVEEAHIDGIVIWQDSSCRIYKTQPNTKPIQIYEGLYDYIASLGSMKK